MSENQEKIETLTINNVEYVRKDSVGGTLLDADGLPYVIVRSREQGVMCGYLVNYVGRTVKIRLARQIWKYDSKFVLNDLAEFGARDASKCKLSCEVTSGDVVMLEACGIIPCSKIGAESLRSIKAQEL